MSMPSMTRSPGTFPPAMRANVGNRSISWTISLLAVPARILPRPPHGERNSQGALKTVNRVPRQGPADPGLAVSTCEGDVSMGRRLRSIVSSEDENRVIANTEFIDRVE